MRFFHRTQHSRFIFFFTIACFFCSCKQQSLFQNRATVGSANREISTGYQIKSQDLLQIRNLQNRRYIVDEPTTSVTAMTNSDNSSGQTYLVEDDGTVALPILGDVKVAGLTRKEAADQIEMLYRKDLRDPIIELKIVNLKVTLLGEIRNQGNYNLVKDRTTLIEIISEGGGLTELASSKKVKIIRGGMEDPQIFEVDLRDVKALSDPRTILQNNDIIYIAKNSRAKRSDRLHSISSILQPIIILLNTALIIYTLNR